MLDIHTPTILVLEPSCTALRGHHFHSILDLARAVRPAMPTVVVNSKMESSLSFGDLEVYRLFQRTIYEAAYNGALGAKPQQTIRRHWWKLKRSVLRMQLHSQLLRHRQLIWPDLLAVAEHVSLLSADHIVLPTAEIDLILELLSYLQGRGELQPQIHARLLSVRPGRQGLKDLDRLCAEFSRHAELGGRLHLYVETPAMQRFLIERYAVPVDLYPYLLSLPVKDNGRTWRGAGNKKTITFGFLGNARAAKGFRRLLPIITAACSSGSFDRRRIAFLVQIDGSANKVDHVRSGLKRLASEQGIDIQLVEGTLGLDAYSKLLDQIDCVLLPYARNGYRFRGSGVLCEALLNAKPFICSAGLSFSDYAREGNAIEASGDAAFAAAILQVASKFEFFRDGAQRAADAYRASLVQTPLLQRLRASLPAQGTERN